MMAGEAESEPVDLGVVSRQVTELTELTASIDKRMATENALTQKRIDGQRKTSRRALIAGVIGTAVGLIALVSVVIAVSVQNDSRRQTTAARLGSCMQQRRSVPNVIAASDAGWATFAAVSWPPASRTPALERQIEAGLQREHDTAVEKNPLRDCTAKGIADFLSGVGGYETTTSTP